MEDKGSRVMWGGQLLYFRWLGKMHLLPRLWRSQKRQRDSLGTLWVQEEAGGSMCPEMGIHWLSRATKWQIWANLGKVKQEQAGTTSVRAFTWNDNGISWTSWLKSDTDRWMFPNDSLVLSCDYRSQKAEEPEQGSCSRQPRRWFPLGTGNGGGRNTGWECALKAQQTWAAREKDQEHEKEPGERMNKEEVERAEGDVLAPDELSKIGSGRCAKCWSRARALK